MQKKQITKVSGHSYKILDALEKREDGTAAFTLGEMTGEHIDSCHQFELFLTKMYAGKKISNEVLAELTETFVRLFYADEDRYKEDK